MRAEQTDRPSTHKSWAENTNSARAAGMEVQWVSGAGGLYSGYDGHGGIVGEGAGACFD